MGANWFIQNPNGSDDQVAFLFDTVPVGETGATGPEGPLPKLAAQIACHAAGGRSFGGVSSGMLDMWVWRAGRTNAVESTAYPDVAQVDQFSGKPESRYPRVDTDNTWPAYMEDMSLTPAGLASDAIDPNWPRTWNGYTGQIYTRNASTQRSVDGQPIRLHHPKVVIRREGTGGPGEEEEDDGPPNGGLPTKLYLFAPQARTFTECDSAATSRPIGSRYPNWSQGLNPGETDVMPGYVLWVPNGSAADVRAKGEYRSIRPSASRSGRSRCVAR